MALIGLVAARLLPLEQFPDIELPFHGRHDSLSGLDARGNRGADHAAGRGCAGDAVRASSRSDPPPARRGDLPDRLRLGHGNRRGGHRSPHQARFDPRAAAARRRACWCLRLPSRRCADHGGAPIRRPRSVLAIRSAGPVPEEADRAHRRRGARAAAGVEPREVRVLVDAGRIAAHGIDLQKLRRPARTQQFLG